MVELGGSGGYAREEIQTVTVTLGAPVDHHGDPVKIYRGSDQMLLVRTIEGDLLAARVVLVCDVSRSMQPYATVYLHLMRAAALLSLRVMNSSPWRGEVWLKRMPEQAKRP